MCRNEQYREESCKDFSKEKDKPFFGIYLNQARLNAFITMREISERLGKSVTDEDSLTEMPLLKLLTGSEDVIQRQRAFDMIDEHFPMLKAINGSHNYENPNEQEKQKELDFLAKENCKVLVLLFKVLNNKRNGYCHFVSEEKKLSDNETRKLERYLDKCFDAGVNQAKKQKHFEDVDVFHLRRKTSTRENGKPKVIDNPNFFYKFFDNSELTQKGLAFLACLFLERRDIFEFLKKQPGYKRSETAADRATLESFCAWHIRVPRPVIKSDDDKNGLALDMLNELRKCPRELYEILDEDKKEDFINEDEDGNEILLMRYSDRFDYFALKYCDDLELFTNLRFQIDLGKYYFKFYDKDTIDGSQYYRLLDKKLKAFGRLKEIKRAVQTEWKDLIKSPNEINEKQDEPFKADSTPHYHIVDNNIKFTISGNSGLPVLEGKLSGSKRAEHEGWLSVYELPAMMFCGLTCGFNKVERLLEKYIKQQNGRLEQIKDTGIIPDNADDIIRKNLGQSYKNNNQYRLNKLNRLIEQSENLLASLENQLARNAENLPGKKNFRDVKAGKLADFLARDILAMQAFDPEKKGKDKITSINFQVLQSSLAFYGLKKDTFGNIFRRAGVVGGGNPHPFLDRLKPANYNSIIDFYRAYLIEKLSFLEACKKEGKPEQYQFLRPTRAAYSGNARELKAAAKEIMDKPINIPRGFFEEKIKEYVCGKTDLPKDCDANSPFLIMQYFLKGLNDNCQKFYNYTRTYPIVEKAKNYRKINKNNFRDSIPAFEPGEDYREIKNKIKNMPDYSYNPENLKQTLLNMCKDMNKTEKLLRRLKVQDMAAMMMINDVLKTALAGEGDLSLWLKDISPKSESEFTKSIECKIAAEMPFNTTVTHFDAPYVNFIKAAGKQITSEQRLQGKKLIVQYKIKSSQAKLKDIGKYRRYLHDRRLPGLLLWKNLAEIDVSEIESELAAYEGNRLAIAEKIAATEKTAIKRMNQTGNYIGFRAIMENIASQFPDLQSECESLLSIRNALYHNQYPVKTYDIDDRQGDSIAAKILAATAEYTERIIAKLNENNS